MRVEAGQPLVRASPDPTPKEQLMFDPTAMIMADRATRHHLLSAHPQAPTTPDRPPRERGDTMRRLTAVALRRLADRLEPRRATCAPAS